MESMQHQLLEVEQTRHDLMPEHQKAQKRSQNIQSIQDRKREYASESAAAQEEMRRIREEIDRNMERFRQLSDKVDKKHDGRCGYGSRTSGIESWRRKKR